MHDPDDETDDAMDSLSWPDTSRPIISNSQPMPGQMGYGQQGYDQGYGQVTPPERYLSRRRRRWPAVLTGVVLLAVLVVILLIWLL